MSPQMTKFLSLFLPFAASSLHQPDVALALANHRIVSYFLGGAVFIVCSYLGFGLSGPTAAPRLAAALGNPGAPKADEPKV
jgi:hypothetical protein